MLQVAISSRAAMAALEQGLARRFREHQELFAATALLQGQVFAPLHDLMSKDDRYLVGVRGLRGLAEHLARRRPAVLPAPRRVRRLTPAGSVRLGPPYIPWTWTAPNSPGVQQASTDEGAGTFQLGVSGGGGSAAAAAGLAVQFQPAADSPLTVFTPPYQYNYNWLDSSALYTAHSSGFLGLMVQSFDLSGQDERTEVDQRVPLWSDGTGWYETHSDNQQGTNLDQRATFAASASRIYLLWVWGQCACDDHSANLLGSSYAQANLVVSLPFVEVGS